MGDRTPGPKGLPTDCRNTFRRLQSYLQMANFFLTGIACSECGRAYRPAEVRVACINCFNETYRITIERSAHGVDWVAVGEIAMSLVVQTPESDLGDVTFSMVSTVGLDRVSGERLGRFIRADMEARRKMFVAWKREENEARFLDGKSACSRCNFRFKAYDNRWNRAGYCSRKCLDTSDKRAPKFRQPRSGV